MLASLGWLCCLHRARWAAGRRTPRGKALAGWLPACLSDPPSRDPLGEQRGTWGGSDPPSYPPGRAAHTAASSTCLHLQPTPLPGPPPRPSSLQVSPGAKDLIQKLLVVNPAKRLTCEQVRNVCARLRCPCGTCAHFFYSGGEAHCGRKRQRLRVARPCTCLRQSCPPCQQQRSVYFAACPPFCAAS